MEPTESTVAKGEPTPTSGRPGGSHPPSKAFFLWVVLGAIGAGGAGWAAGEWTRETFRPSSAAANEPYAFKQFNFEKDLADGRNAAIVYGTLGALTGLALGFMAGLATGSTRRAIVVGVVGALLGGVAAALPCPWVVPLHRRHYDLAEPSLTLPLMIHGAIWAAMGLGAGLGLAFGCGDRRKLIPGAVGGLIGGAIAALLYNASIALLFAGEFVVDLPISPHGPARVLACLLVPTCVALGAAWGVCGSRRTP